MVAQPARTPQPLRPSLRSNSVVPQSNDVKPPPQHRSPQSIRKGSDENSSGALGSADYMTFAAELSRAGEKLGKSEPPSTTEDDMSFEFVSIEDVSPLSGFRDVQSLDDSDRTTVSVIPVNVTNEEDAVTEIDLTVGSIAPYKEMDDVNATTTTGDCHHLKGQRTIREHRLQYLNEMHAILNKPAPKLPPAFYEPTSPTSGSRWTIQGGVIGDWKQSPMRKPTEFDEKFSGSAWDFWRAKVNDLDERCPRRRAAKQRATEAQQAEQILRDMVFEIREESRRDEELLEIFDVEELQALVDGNLDPAYRDGVVE